MAHRLLRALKRSYPGDTVEGMKIAISVPDGLFAAGEDLAREMKVSRSELYARALREYVATRSASAITANLDRVYASQKASIDPALARAQIAALPDESW